MLFVTLDQKISWLVYSGLTEHSIPGIQF